LPEERFVDVTEERFVDVTDERFVAASPSASDDCCARFAALAPSTANDLCSVTALGCKDISSLIALFFTGSDFVSTGAGIKTGEGEAAANEAVDETDEYELIFGVACVRVGVSVASFRIRFVRGEGSVDAPTVTGGAFGPAPVPIPIPIPAPAPAPAPTPTLPKIVFNDGSSITGVDATIAPITGVRNDGSESAGPYCGFTDKDKSSGVAEVADVQRGEIEDGMGEGVIPVIACGVGGAEAVLALDGVPTSSFVVRYEPNAAFVFVRLPSPPP
jgi:hypothetical protein